MAPKLLVAALKADDRPYVDNLLQLGVDVRVLDCFEKMHASVQAWYPNCFIHVPAHHLAVKQAVQAEAFDAAVIMEIADDFVRTALLAQTLRDAHVGQVIVISKDIARVNLYRRCGAHQIIIAHTPDEIWNQVEPYLFANVTAS